MQLRLDACWARILTSVDRVLFLMRNIRLINIIVALFAAAHYTVYISILKEDAIRLPWAIEIAVMLGFLLGMEYIAAHGENKVQRGPGYVGSLILLVIYVISFMSYAFGEGE